MASAAAPAADVLHPRAAAFTVEARGLERRLGLLFATTGIGLVVLMGVLGLVLPADDAARRRHDHRDAARDDGRARVGSVLDEKRAELRDTFAVGADSTGIGTQASVLSLEELDAVPRPWTRLFQRTIGHGDSGRAGILYRTGVAASGWPPVLKTCPHRLCVSVV